MSSVYEEALYRTETEPDIEVGAVVERERVVEEMMGMYVTRRLVAVGDESDPIERRTLRAVGDAFEIDLIDNPQWIAPSEDNFDSNPASQWLYTEDPAQTSMQKWSRLFPSAKALYPLQRLDDGGRVLPGGVIDERAKYLFTNMVDGIGLRARGRVMADMLVEVSNTFRGETLECVSLGCGAAVPDINATLRIQQATGADVNWHLYDISKDALDFARELADEAGIDQSTISTFEGLYVRAFSKKPESAHVVDVLGLWEYLDDRTCVKLLKRSYKLLKPGGSFIASNMLSDRPQLEFNLRGVGWPSIIKPRSEEQLFAIVAAADLDTESFTFTRSDDGVYGVMEIKKS